MITRGAGARDSRELSLALDGLGVDRDESVGAVNIRFWGSTLARNVPAALDIYADIVLRPHLPEAELEPVQALALQDIQSLEDAPQQKVMVELRRRYYPHPLSKDRPGRADAAVLSGGMSSRLFAEVREKRGLCYSVYAFHETFKDRGTMLAYAGTRSDRAQQTLDVTVGELRRLKDGIEDDEIDRVKAGLKSSLIMQEESTSARAGAI